MRRRYFPFRKIHICNICSVYRSFSDKPVFDSSLFVTIRKRLQIEDPNSFILSLTKAGKKEDDASDNSDNDDDTHNGDIKMMPPAVMPKSAILRVLIY